MKKRIVLILCMLSVMIHSSLPSYALAESVPGLENAGEILSGLFGDFHPVEDLQETFDTFKQFLYSLVPEGLSDILFGNETPEEKNKQTESGTQAEEGRNHSRTGAGDIGNGPRMEAEAPTEEQVAEDTGKQAAASLKKFQAEHKDKGAVTAAIIDTIEDIDGAYAESAVYELGPDRYLLEEDKTGGNREFYWISYDNKGGVYEQHFYSVDVQKETVKEFLRESGMEYVESTREEVNGKEISFSSKIDNAGIDKSMEQIREILLEVLTEKGRGVPDSEQMAFYTNGTYRGNVASPTGNNYESPGYGELQWIAACIGPDLQYYEFSARFDRKSGEFTGNCITSGGTWFNRGESIDSDIRMSPELKEQKDKVRAGFLKAVKEAAGRDLEKESEIRIQRAGDRWKIRCILDTGAEIIFRSVLDGSRFRAHWEESYINGDDKGRELFEDLKDLETSL